MSKIFSLLEKVFLLSIYLTLAYGVMVSIASQLSTRIDSWQKCATIVFLDLLWLLMIVIGGALLVSIIKSKSTE